MLISCRYDTDISPFSFWCIYAQKIKFIDDLTLNCQVSGLVLLLKCPTIFAGVTSQQCAWKFTEIETQTPVLQFFTGSSGMLVIYCCKILQYIKFLIIAI